MEYWLPDTIEPDPAPALTRGLTILATLARDGASTLEALVRTIDFPKTSVLRLLRALCDCGAVERDVLTKRYSANVLLQKRKVTDLSLIHRVREVMAGLSQQFGHTCELYCMMNAGLSMVDRAHPEEMTVTAIARIGHYRDLREIESLCLVYRAWGNASITFPKDNLWQWDEHCKEKSIKFNTVQSRVKQTRKQCYAIDETINPNSVRRYSVPIFTGSDSLTLWGILSLAQVVHPSNILPDENIIQAITDAGQILSGQLFNPVS